VVDLKTYLLPHPQVHVESYEDRKRKENREMCTVFYNVERCNGYTLQYTQFLMPICITDQESGLSCLLRQDGRSTILNPTEHSCMQ